MTTTVDSLVWMYGVWGYVTLVLLWLRWYFVGSVGISLVMLALDI